jgi:GNAT superfamily N-acetyltransferase
LEYGGVLTEYRQRGIYSKLIQHVENNAFKRGFNYIAVWATFPNFYEKRGYVRIKELPVIQDTDGTLTSMVKNLKEHYGH